MADESESVSDRAELIAMLERALKIADRLDLSDAAISLNAALCKLGASDEADVARLIEDMLP